MGFIPVDKSGKMAYPYDTRDFRAKVLMWFWEHVGIPLTGGTVRGGVFEFEHVKGEKAKYVNCTFKRCRFDGLRLVFVLNSYIEFDTANPEFHNMSMCAVRNCHFKKVKPIIK